MIKSFLLVGLGGGLGSILRYAASLLYKNNTTNFPYSTLFVNAIGCLLIGLLVGYLERQQVVSNELKLLFITGFCGGFTTFSAFSSETIFLLQNNQISTAILYVFISLCSGFLLTFLGIISFK
jgi:CrcB protein